MTTQGKELLTEYLSYFDISKEVFKNQKELEYPLIGEVCIALKKLTEFHIVLHHDFSKLLTKYLKKKLSIDEFHECLTNYKLDKLDIEKDSDKLRNIYNGLVSSDDIIEYSEYEKQKNYLILTFRPKIEFENFLYYPEMFERTEVFTYEELVSLWKNDKEKKYFK